MLRVVVTGANGFVGRAVTAALTARGHQVVGCVRDQKSVTGLDCNDVVYTGPLEHGPDLAAAFTGADAVVHTANWSGAATRGLTPGYIDAVNVGATAKLGQTAMQSGVGQFLFVSSIKAVGDRTDNVPFHAASVPAPADPYGRSKLAAEGALLAIPGLRATLIRPPLLYGPHVKGSMLMLYNLAARGVPLPVSCIANRRDLLSVRLLADLIATCLEQPSHSSRTFLARDGETVSSAGLYQRVAASLGKNARLFPLPPSVLRFAGAVTGRQVMVDSLLSSLEIDDRETRERLNWAPPASMDKDLRATAEWYLPDSSPGLS